MSETVLFDYWRSSASYRLRIALNLAGVAYRTEQVDLRAGEQMADAHMARNPQGFVPVLELDGLRLTQSMAIIEYLDETRGCGFLPDDAAARARVRALAYVIAMDIHPICNLSVARHVVDLTGGDKAVMGDWMRHFIRRGLVAFEALLDDPGTGAFCHGDRPGLADICLMPQLYNAERWGVEIADLVRIGAIAERCRGEPGFAAAIPAPPKD